MAPNKFEKHIKKEFQEREIQPSVSAWDSLSERLDDVVAPQSKKRNNFWYVGIAASFIGLLIFSLMYFKAENPRNTPDILIVDSEENSDAEKEKQQIIIPKEAEEIVNAIQKEEIDVIKNEKSVIGKIKKQPVQLTEMAIVPKKVIPIGTTTSDKILIENKILEVIAQVDSIEKNNSLVTESEVDALLKNAQKELLLDKKLQEKGVVDAMQLLTEVEDELDQSFRDKLFERLKTGFIKVRTAVADNSH